VSQDWSTIGAERLLDDIADRAPALLFALDSDGFVTLSIGRGLAALGLEPGELVGVNMFESFRSPDGPRLVDRILAGERVETRVPFAGGQTLQMWLGPIREGDRVTGVYGFGFDLSEQLEVARERRTYRSLTEASPQFIAVFDMAGKVRYVNPGGRAMLGIPADRDVTGMDWAEFFSEAELERIQRVGTPAVRRTGRFEGEGTLRHWETGRDIPVHNTTFVLSDGAGRPSGYATIRSDISEIVAAREVERELSDHQRSMLLHLHEAQDAERRRIAGDVHDDTIQVLAAVNLRLQILRRLVATQTEPGAVLEALGLLDESVRGATGRLRSLLLDLDPPPVDQVGIEEQLRRRAESALADEGVVATVECRLVTPPAELVGGVLLRIAQEALSNVKKHAEAKNVVLSLDERSAEYVLRVEDDGVGLPAGRIEEGHLGVRSMVERAESIGGRCSFLSEPGKGTTVEAVLPVRIGHLEDVRAASAKLVLEQTMANFSEGYLALDNDWRIVFANRAVYQHGGTARPFGWLVGKNFWDVFEEAGTPEFGATYRRAQELNAPLTVTGFYPPTGRWMENRVIPTPSGLSIFSRDVSEEVRLAQEAAEREQLVQGGTEVTDALAGEPDPVRALQRALDAAVHYWKFQGAVLRIAAPNGAGTASLVITSGDATDDAHGERHALLAAGVEVGELEFFPDARRLRPTLLGLFALRIAADFPAGHTA
jgi:PAS domain S-box-containing protein